MIKLYFFLFISSLCFGQENDSIQSNFSVNDNKIIVWTEIFETENLDIIKNLKTNAVLTFVSDNTGYVISQNLRCPTAQSIYAMSNFKFNFRIDVKEKKYRVQVSNIIFNNDINYNFGGVITTKSEANIEEYELRTRDNKIRKNWQSVRNLNCLSQHLIGLFFEQKDVDNSKW